MPDIVLVAMPFIDINRPSLALGTLKAILARAGIESSIHCAYLRFAEIVTAGAYVSINRSASTTLLGEWVYSPAAFPDKSDSLEGVLDVIFSDLVHRLDHDIYVRQRERSRVNLQRLAEQAKEHVEETARAVLEMNPRIVGCTSTFQQHVASLALLRRIRELAPNVVTMMGGANCEARMGVTTHRNFAWVDYLVSGDADATIVSLVRGAIEHGRDIPLPELPPGVFAPKHRVSGYPDDPAHPGEPSRSVFIDLDALPYPDFSDYFSALDSSHLGPAIRPGLVAETSRGCWWGAVKHCTFCGLNGGGMTFRSKSPRRTLEEFEFLATRWGIDSLEIVDNILDMKYFNDVLPQLRDSQRNWRIFYETKSNLKRGQVRALADAGVRWIQPGIESLHSKVLALIDKGAFAYQQVLLLKWARESGVRLSWNMLWGFPDEDDAWYAEMAEFVPALAHLQPPSGPSKVRFDRFSPYFNRAGDYRLRLRPLPMTDLIYPMSDHDRFEQSYFFVDEPDDDSPRIETNRPGYLKLRRAISEWQQSFPEYRRVVNGILKKTPSEEPPPAPNRPVPQLVMRDDGTTLHVLDTRTCAVQPEMKLSGLARAIHLAAEESIGERQLAAVLSKEFSIDAPQSEIDAVLDELRATRLLLTLDGRHISLALSETIPAWPFDYGWFPGGEVDLEKASVIETDLATRRNLVEMLM
jgi:ribosomal peptide maturation radical SAM protein 1